MRKVYITGLGFISSIGNDLLAVSESLRELRHGMVQYPPFQKPDVPVKVAAPIRDFQTDTTDQEDWIFPARYNIRRETLRGMAPHGIYPAREAEADAWLSIAVADDEQWQAFTQLVPNEPWAQLSRYAHSAGRLDDARALDEALAAWSVTHARDSLVTTLREIGIAASPVLSVEEQWCDAHFVARAIKHRVSIPIYGEEDLFCAPWRFADFAPRITRCGPGTGEHNDYVFGELLGMPTDEIRELKEAGVIA